MFQAPAHLTKVRHLFYCVSFNVSIVPRIATRFLNANGRVHTVTYLRLFLSFSSHKFLHLFTIAHPFFFFLLPLVPSLFFFFIAIFFYSHLYAHLFYRPQLYSSALPRARLSPVGFSFHSSQSSRNVRLLTTHIPR